jgi:serine/threonine protein kinase
VGHTKSVDFWSFGVTLFILLLYESPFYSENIKEVLQMVVSQEIDWSRYENKLSPEAFSLLQGLLCKDPLHRLGEAGANQIKQHPFFATIDWDSLPTSTPPPFLRPKIRVR